MPQDQLGSPTKCIANIECDRRNEQRKQETHGFNNIFAGFKMARAGERERKDYETDDAEGCNEQIDWNAPFFPPDDALFR